MTKVFILRHQVAGFLPEFLFVSAPTAEQIAPVASLMARRHGVEHPKTKELYWLKVVELDVIQADEIPNIPLPGDGGTANRGALAGVSVSGEGTVTGP